MSCSAYFQIDNNKHNHLFAPCCEKVGCNCVGCNYFQRFSPVMIELIFISIETAASNPLFDILNIFKLHIPLKGVDGKLVGNGRKGVEQRMVGVFFFFPVYLFIYCP